MSTAYAASGRPVYNDELSTAKTTITEVIVTYPTKTWSRSSSRMPPPGPALYGCKTLLPFGCSWTEHIRAILGCGIYSIAGHERVDGVNAIKIVESDQVPGKI